MHGLKSFILGSQLPEAYRKFWFEWHHQKPVAVHYIPKEGKFERHPTTGIVHPVQNVPIPLKRVREEWDGIWGGEAVIQGFRKKKLNSHRVPYYWVPTLKRTVIHSEILDEYRSVVVTDRTISLIHENFGFDHYILKTPACDLRSILALKIKRELLHELQADCPTWNHDKERKQEIQKVYGKYLEQYTPEDIEWYGLSWLEAVNKQRRLNHAEDPVVPHKVIFRQKLIEQLRAAGIDEAKDFEIEPEK